MHDERASGICVGSTGAAWAVVVARAGFAVSIHDAATDRLWLGRDELGAPLSILAKHILLGKPAAAVAIHMESPWS